MEKEPSKPSSHRRHHSSKPSNHHQRERLGLGIPSDDAAAARRRSHEQSRETASSASDFLLRWGNRKRLRCMKMNKSDSSPPVHKSTTDRSDRKPVNGSKDRFDFTRHRNTSPPTAQRALRNSEIMRVQSSNGGDSKGAAVSRDMKTHHQKHHSNGAVGGCGGSSDHDNKKGVGGGGGGGCSSGSEAVPAVWPLKFVIALTNKEKEEDFMAIKGSKLPQRPKKRAKLIQRTLNSVSPGTWLCDLTLDRYEVREKKTSKKRPRGLKAMGNMESDSDS
uniref:Uncharacterized protein n=1 Tax=Kalanchoe fedtschenkoi TaxID=63787 RepID=A0A7N0V3D9_KALFE